MERKEQQRKNKYTGLGNFRNKGKRRYNKKNKEKVEKNKPSANMNAIDDVEDLYKFELYALYTYFL
jgi:hypothetical protein